MIEFIETAPFDFTEMLCPLEEAVRLVMGEKGMGTPEETNWEAVGIKSLIERANEIQSEFGLGALREPMRVLFLPGFADYKIVLLMKADHAGTCYWFSYSMPALRTVEMLMEEQSE